MSRRSILAAMSMALLVLAWAGCRKYPEDRFISFRKPSSRLAGQWKITQYNFNNNSILDMMDASVGFNVLDLTLNVSKKTRKTPQHYAFDGNYLNVEQEDDPLQDNNAEFEFRTGAASQDNSLLRRLFITPLRDDGQSSAKWDIRNLYLHKLHLQLKTDSGSYDVFFDKQ